VNERLADNRQRQNAAAGDEAGSHRLQTERIGPGVVQADKQQEQKQ
jgi:hypothetical protein